MSGIAAASKLYKPPRTISQLASYARKLTIVNHDGSIKQLGLMPNYNLGGGGANYFQLWGNVFGGTWYDPVHKKTTAADPHNVQALTWLANFWKTYGPSKLDRFEAGFGTYLGPNDPFARGKIAMLIDGDWWPFYVPKGFHLGGAYLPYPDGHPALAHTSGVFGDVMLIPKGSATARKRSAMSDSSAPIALRIRSGNSGRNISTFKSATMSSTFTVGCVAKYCEPSRPFSSPVTATNRTERRNFAPEWRSAAAVSSSVAMPDALSIAPL